MIKESKLKWTAMVFPQQLKQGVIETKPESTKAFSTDTDMLIHEAMEYNWSLEYRIKLEESIYSLYGTTIFIDYVKKELRVKGMEHSIHFVPFHNLISAKKAE
ncbi:hypothetical protein NQZ71_07340 [Niallia taxi]|uniref:hypothetical protein n=1 Tax=Niallia taxi TaxID=2499688 RepID=UPI0021A404F6|nr:hypothetical protein [Niallia taxi]MCT2343095.1 hypothetical protein [Niallia taxi]WOD64134.1 hypothetical protein NQZ71_07340 [Niallia taxi]